MNVYKWHCFLYCNSSDSLLDYGPSLSLITSSSYRRRMLLKIIVSQKVSISFVLQCINGQNPSAVEGRKLLFARRESLSPQQHTLRTSFFHVGRVNAKKSRRRRVLDRPQSWPYIKWTVHSRSANFLFGHNLPGLHFLS